MNIQYKYLLSLFKDPSVKKTLIASIVSFCILLIIWSPYFSLPIYPDEVAYQISTGRWFQEGFKISGLNGICHPEGVLIPVVFWPATILTSIIHALIFGLKAERVYPMLLMGGVFAATIGCLTQKISLKHLAFLPIAIAAFGVLPVQIQLLRPEFLWIILALLLFVCALLRGHKYSKTLATLSVALFYIGSYLHPEFIFLVPALILNFARQRIKLYIKLIVIILILFFITSSLGYLREFIDCSEFPKIQSSLTLISTPYLSLSFAKDSIANVLFPMDTMHVLPHLKMLNALPDLKVSQSFKMVNISYALLLLVAFLSGLVLSFLLFSNSIIRKIKSVYEQSYKSRISGYEYKESLIYKSNKERQDIVIPPNHFTLNTNADITLISLIYLSGFLLYFLDPSHVFYRNLAFFITSSFCLVVYIDQIVLKLKLEKSKRYLVSAGILFLPVLMGILSTIYSFGIVMPLIIVNGYSGPSVPLKALHSSIDIKTSNLIYNTLIQANSSHERIILDDYTYRFVRSRYKQVFPITYLGLYIEMGASRNIISSKLNGTPVIVTCELKSPLPFKLLAPPIEVPYYHNICIGKVDNSLVSSN